MYDAKDVKSQPLLGTKSQIYKDNLKSEYTGRNREGGLHLWIIRGDGYW